MSLEFTPGEIQNNLKISGKSHSMAIKNGLTLVTLEVRTSQ